MGSANEPGDRSKLVAGVQWALTAFFLSIVAVTTYVRVLAPPDASATPLVLYVVPAVVLVGFFAGVSWCRATAGSATSDRVATARRLDSVVVALVAYVILEYVAEDVFYALTSPMRQPAYAEFLFVVPHALPLAIALVVAYGFDDGLFVASPPVEDDQGRSDGESTPG